MLGSFGILTFPAVFCLFSGATVCFTFPEPMKKKATTPMMLQYRQAKAEIAPGTILFFRLGDF